MIDILIHDGQAIALLHRRGENVIHRLEGKPLALDRLDQIPRRRGAVVPPGETFDTLSAVPFSQIKERGFAAIDDGARILCLNVTRHDRVPVSDFLAGIDEEPVELDGGVDYAIDRDRYKGVLRTVIDREIGNGEGANFVIPRTARARIREMSLRKAIAIFRRLVRGEYGSYWNFLFFDGERYLVGATPEKHLHVHRGMVRMNPISGTLRKPPGLMDPAQFKRDLIAFLADSKETNELFMVVDEEIKMMAKLCGTGGMVIGPLLKEMSRLVHTEYLLSGRSDRDPLELFRGSMFAATVTGSPLANACNVITRYETEARRYYGSALVLIGRDSEGHEFLDSPITIRTLEIDREGHVLFKVGGTLVRDSDPATEVLETESKAAALLACLGGPAPGASQGPTLPGLAGDEDLAESLQRRNQHLSRFWFFEQDALEDRVDLLCGRRVTVVDNGDDFCFMLRHMVARMGCDASVIGWAEFDPDLDRSEVVIVGPGPGDPRDDDSDRMRRVASAVDRLKADGRRFIAVCLGHQMLCRALGLEIGKKRFPFQGTQEVIDLFGSRERVGFYNTFAARHKELAHVEIAYDPETREVHALKSACFVGFQFHPESILTKNGFLILKDALLHLTS